MNNKGQALVESIFILPLSLMFFIFIVYYLLYFTIEIAIDDALESRLLCAIQKRSDCESQFQSQIQHLPVQVIDHRLQQNNNLYSLRFEGRALHFFKIKKTRILNYETRI